MSQITSFRTSSGGGGVQGVPGFMAILDTGKNNITGNGTRYNLICPVVTFDTTGDYDPITGIYTVPQTGLYHFECFVSWLNTTTGYTGVFFQKNGANDFNVNFPYFPNPNPFNGFTISNSLLVYLTVGETIRVVLFGNGAGADTFGVDGSGTDYESTFFSGALLSS